MTTATTHQLAQERLDILRAQATETKRMIRRLAGTRDVSGLRSMLARIQAEIANG
jgi:hypothetical protein